MINPMRDHDPRAPWNQPDAEPDPHQVERRRRQLEELKRRNAQ